MHRKLKLLGVLLATSAFVTGVAVAATSPSVSTGGTTSRTNTSAVLHASVNPNGDSTHYGFQWGLTKTYGVLSSARTLAAGTKPVAVTATAGKLIPGTVYHYRVIASNRYGAGLGQDRTFKTTGNPPPGATTGPASQITSSGATVSGVINPNGDKTVYDFQYGLTGLYGSQTFSQTVPAGGSPVTVTSTLAGLSSGTWFHYRLVAVHPDGQTTPGVDATFFTYPSPRPNPRVTMTVRPHRTSKRPFTFATAGKVTGPSWIPQPQSCFENVYVRYFLGKRQVSFQEVPLASNCTYSATTMFKGLPGRGKRHRTVRLSVQVHFRGNPYLAPTDTKSQTVTLVG